MQVGIIAPIKFLEQYCITSIQYCLPSLLVDSLPYRDFYIGRKKEGCTLILDCRKVSWKRIPESFETTKRALDIVEPDIVIAPSYMFNQRASAEILGAFKEEFSSSTYKIVRCLEGTLEEELEPLLKNKAIAVPSHMYRMALPLCLDPQTIYIENHLSIGELDGRDGILVTSLPVRLGLQGRLLTNYRPTPNSLTFYEEEDRYEMITKRNVADTIDYYEGE